MKSPEYQESDLDLPLDVRPLTAEFFVDWLIDCHGLPEDSRETVVSKPEARLSAREAGRSAGAGHEASTSSGEQPLQTAVEQARASK